MDTHARVGTTVRLIRPTSPEWNRRLAMVPHDFYHTAAYHRFSEDRGEGEAFLAVYGTDEEFVAWPYLLRRVADREGLEDSRLHDVVSVYGYPGPLVRSDSADVALHKAAWNAFVGLWRQQQVVTVFTRFHPLLANQAGWTSAAPSGSPLSAAGDEAARSGVVVRGQTVAIDLEAPESDMLRQYQKILRQEIARARRQGLRTEEDHDWTSLDVFAALYRQTMTRNGASADYFFSADDFVRLRRALAPHVHLMITRLDEQVAAAGLFVEYERFVHAHLAGSNEALRSLSPLKVLLDDVRRWGQERGNRLFHLGGGRGGSDDSLLAFKGRFSQRRYEFVTGCWILDAAAYRSLCDQRRDYAERGRLEPASTDFFPVYRAPLAKRPPDQTIAPD